MSEPATTAGASAAAVGAAAGWKLLGGLAGGAALAATLSAVVVMCMTRPRSDREWTVALISTVMSSVCGGAALVQYFSLQSLAGEWAGLVSLLGLAFVAGLPGWALVRWAFNWIEKREGLGLDEVLSDLRKGSD